MLRHTHPTVVPCQLFEAPDGPFGLAVGNVRMFADFCNRVILRPDLVQKPRHAILLQRALHWPELPDAIQRIAETRTPAHWLEACLAADASARPLKSSGEALKATPMAERGVIQTLDHPGRGPVSPIRPGPGLAARAGNRPKAPPLLGKDMRGVPRNIPGFDHARIESLIAQGDIVCHTLSPTRSADLAGTMA